MNKAGAFLRKMINTTNGKIRIIISNHNSITTIKAIIEITFHSGAEVKEEVEDIRITIKDLINALIIHKIIRIIILIIEVEVVEVEEV